MTVQELIAHLNDLHGSHRQILIQCETTRSNAHPIHKTFGITWTDNTVYLVPDDRVDINDWMGIS